ncbi:hypothetical protein [Paenibacillus sp. PvP052]|uniref:hypothetical protein n=1 Tax=Paenibacillus sp. PvP052 TaxID=2817853 RepID=UPI001D2F1CF5|nr:hypothetical protein [Paenibacillus sp. PvP052]MBP2442561.1 hypothetical protein [Paenibacillus sp. PvP052]
MEKISFEDWKMIGEEVTRIAREKAWAEGSFYSYGEAGKVIRAYPDGRKTEVILDEKGNRQEIPYEDGNS